MTYSLHESSFVCSCEENSVYESMYISLFLQFYYLYMHLRLLYYSSNLRSIQVPHGVFLHAALTPLAGKDVPEPKRFVAGSGDDGLSVRRNRQIEHSQRVTG